MSRAHQPVDYSAAAARLVEVSERYPLYSQSDEALWMLSDVYERVKKFSKNEDDKNHWAIWPPMLLPHRDRVSSIQVCALAKARLQGMVWLCRRKR